MPEPSVPREPSPGALERPQAGSATTDTPGAGNGAPDLTAGRLESIRARAVQGYAPTMRDTLTLVAEVERLRADSVPRSALVAQPRYHHDECMGAEFGCYCQPVYSIREDTDA